MNNVAKKLLLCIFWGKHVSLSVRDRSWNEIVGSQEIHMFSICYTEGFLSGLGLRAFGSPQVILICSQNTESLF